MLTRFTSVYKFDLLENIKFYLNTEVKEEGVWWRIYLSLANILVLVGANENKEESRRVNLLAAHVKGRIGANVCMARAKQNMGVRRWVAEWG
jgi:hypothetical protein